MKIPIISLVLTSASALAAGPSGFGDIKIGMSFSEIEALKPDSVVRVTAPMVAFPIKNPNVNQNSKFFRTTVITPYSTGPQIAVFEFRENLLKSMRVQFEYSQVVAARLKSDIAEKYGAPSEKNARKEEQCIYRNGNSFKLETGQIVSSWTEMLAGEQIETEIIDDVHNSCPNNLAVGGFELKSLWLVVKTKEEVGGKKKVNVF